MKRKDIRMAENGIEPYEVNIPLFEGPLDLLLHLVTKNRIDIHDIPIHLITDQYLAYLEKAREFNLELGSSFFAMASTLLLIKSRMLLPKKRQEEADDSEDPRQELSRSLEEFKKMKEIRARIEYLMDEERPYRTREPEVFKSGAYRGRISLARLQAAFSPSTIPSTRKRNGGCRRRKYRWMKKSGSGRKPWAPGRGCGSRSI